MLLLRLAYYNGSWCHFGDGLVDSGTSRSSSGLLAVFEMFVPWVAMIHADATTFLLSLHPVFFL
jgi:hypothetical protein